MGVFDGISRRLDHVAGSADEAVARQFDEVQGGGFADEAGAVFDPRRAASPQTERDLRTATAVNPVVAPIALPAALTSDALDTLAGKDVPTAGDDDPLTTPQSDDKRIIPKGLHPNEIITRALIPGGGNGNDNGGGGIPWLKLLAVVSVLAILAGQFGKLLTFNIGDGA